MNTIGKPIALLIIALSTTALAKDEAPRFKAGEWQIEITQGGGATFKDSKSKREDGTTSISSERPTQVVTRCFKKKETVLTPEMLAPGCTASNVASTPSGMKADLSCGNVSMTMTGSVSMTIENGGKKMSGFQVLSGGGEAVGAVIMSNIEMKHMGKCKKK